MNLKVKPFPTLAQSWGIIGIFIAASFILGMLVSPLSLSSNGLMKELGTLIATASTYVVVILYALREKKMRAQFPYVYYKNAVSPWVYLALIPLTLSIGIVIEPIGNLMESIPLPEPLDAAMLKFKEIVEAALKELTQSAVIPFLMVAIIAPVMEEILCRGIILEGLLQNYKPAKAIVWSAILFAVLHLNPWQGIPAFLIGIILAWVYWKTRSVLPCIFIHFVNNCTSFIVTKFVDNPNASIQELVGNNTNYWYAYAGSAVVFILVAWWLYNKYKSYPKEEYGETTTN